MSGTVGTKPIVSLLLLSPTFRSTPQETDIAKITEKVFGRSTLVHRHSKNLGLGPLQRPPLVLTRPSKRQRAPQKVHGLLKIGPGLREARHPRNMSQRVASTVWESEIGTKQSQPWQDITWYKWYTQRGRDGLQHKWRTQNTFVSPNYYTTNYQPLEINHTPEGLWPLLPSQVFWKPSL